MLRYGLNLPDYIVYQNRVDRVGPPNRPGVMRRAIEDGPLRVG